VPTLDIPLVWVPMALPVVHTVAASGHPQLYQLAQDGFRPAKYFSIDRVFRNEAIDRTHLAEFHQVGVGFRLFKGFVKKP
jgi:hypothetical protein